MVERNRRNIQAYDLKVTVPGADIFFGIKYPSALSRLQIRVDWRQTLQMQEAVVKTGSVDPLNRGDAADGALAANPAGRGPGGRELWRSSSMYIPYTFLLASRPQPPGPPSTLICRRDRALDRTARRVCGADCGFGFFHPQPNPHPALQLSSLGWQCG